MIFLCISLDQRVKEGHDTWVFNGGEKKRTMDTELGVLDSVRSLLKISQASENTPPRRVQTGHVAIKHCS